MTCFTVERKGLKYTTYEDIGEHVRFLEKQSLEKDNAITSVVLSGNSFGIEASKAISEALLPWISTIASVDLSDVFTGRLKDEVPQSLAHFSQLLQKCTSLATVNLSDNAFGPAGAKAMASFLSSSPSLVNLDLNNNGLGQIGGSIVADSLVKASHGRGPCMKIISMGRNRLENEGAVAMSKAIEAHASSLEKVSFYQNGIRSNGVVAISKAFFDNTHASNLRVIELHDNTFTLDGSIAFSKYLIPSVKGTLEILDLNDCLLTRRGSKMILKALLEYTPEKLTYLGLQYNGIKEKDLSLLMKLAKVLKLERLLLNGNSFSSTSEAFLSLKNILSSEDILDSLSDMEEEEDGEEEDDEDEEEEENEPLTSSDEKWKKKDIITSLSPDKEAAFDQLAELMAKTTVEDSENSNS